MSGGPSHQLDAADLRAGLPARRVGREIIVLPEVGSTNSHALDVLAEDGGTGADGVVVFAEHQTAGRGRMGRHWHSPRGASLTFTVLLCDHQDPLPPARLVMIAAVAVVAGIEQATEVAPVIRWPNDIYIGDKKLAGILIERRPLSGGGNATALGVGVNCLQHAAHFPQEIRHRATSLELEAPHPVDRTAVARAILRQLEDHLADAPPTVAPAVAPTVAPASRRCSPTDETPVPQDTRLSDDRLAAEWQAHSADIGAHVTLSHDGRTFTGRIVQVHPQSGLLLQLDTGARREFDPMTTTRI